MNSGITRRTALRGAAVLGAGMAAAGTASASEFKELNWHVSVPGIGAQPFRTRIVSGVPVSVGYGKPIALGPVIVQAMCGFKTWNLARATAYDAFSGTVTMSVIVTDGRGLSGLFPITVVFPRASIPSGGTGDYTLTGTATLSGTAGLPMPRNPGTMTLAVDTKATGAMTAYKTVAGTSTPFPSQITLDAGQDPVVAAIEVR